MTIRSAVNIVVNLDTVEVDDDTKAEAISMVLKMPSKMSITKDTLTKAAQWLYNKLYPIEEVGNE